MAHGRMWTSLPAAAGALAASLLGGGCFNCGFDASCGDGIVDPGESCDDGNRIDDDACTNRCEIGICLGCGVCGDGILDPGEQCDDGNLINDDGCNWNCLVEVIGNCGDGIITLGEECDDGNNASGDGCDAFCRAELAPGQCGNGVLEPGEFCDTTFGCNPDCIYSCAAEACLEPILVVGQSDGESAVHDPIAAHPPGPIWAVAWQLSPPGEPGLVPAAAYVGSSILAATGTLDPGFLSVSADLTASAEGYVFVSAPDSIDEDRLVRLLAPDLTPFADLPRQGAWLVRANARKDAPVAWLLAAEQADLYALERLDAPGISLALPSPTPAGAEPPPPAIAVHADGSAVVAHAYGPGPTFVWCLVSPGGGVGFEYPFPGTWGPEGPALAALGPDPWAWVAAWRDTTSGELRVVLNYGLPPVPDEYSLELGTGVAVAEAEPSVASTPAGDFVVAWSVDEAGCRRIRVAVLDSLGQLYETPFEPDGAPFIGSGTDCSAREPSVDVAPNGEMVLAWAGCPAGGKACPVVQARRFPGLVP